MENKKEIMEALAKVLNNSCLTVREFSKEWGYPEPNYLAKKVKKLNLGYKLKGIYLLSQKEQQILKASIQRKFQQENNNKDFIYLEEDNESLKQVESLLIEDLNKNYCTVTELSKIMGYIDNSYISRKAKKLKLGLKIKTITLLSKEDQEILKKSIKRRGSKFSSE